MLNKLLLTFNRNCYLENNIDLGEKLGNIGLGLLRIGFGKTINVKKFSDKTRNIFFSESTYNTTSKVAAIALFILAFPITILLAGIGYIATKYSKSQTQIFNLYDQNIKKVITIQKYIRGYLARKPHLPNSLFPHYHDQCEKLKQPQFHSIPEAEGGKTRVYLPPAIPSIVLKKAGRKNAIERFHQMQKVRSILESQNSSHLVIPKANLCDEFLVEQKLPINVDSFHNMEVYLSQPKLFDEAVRELTRLFSRVYLSDLVSSQVNPLGHISGVGDFVRYDNLPLYIVGEKGIKKGKIGLIDLEHMQLSPNPKSLDTLARIFPLHLDIIKNEANKLKMSFNESSLESSASKGRKYLEIGFTNHLEWLSQNDISTDNFSKLFTITPQRKDELTTRIKNELLKLNQGINELFSKKGYFETPQKNFFTDNPEELAQELAVEIIPLLIKNTKEEIKQKQIEALGKIDGEKITRSHLVSLRSPYIKRRKLYKGIESLIARHPKVSLETKMGEHRDIVTQLTEVYMRELVSGGEIFYFDPAYYTAGHDTCWIRY